MSELRTAVLAAVATRIDALPRPARVAVDGVTAAGKTTFADELVDRAVALERAIVRDAARMNGVEAARARYASRYVPGETLYLEAVDPERRADVVIDTTDPQRQRS